MDGCTHRFQVLDQRFCAANVVDSRQAGVIEDACTLLLDMLQQPPATACMHASMRCSNSLPVVTDQHLAALVPTSTNLMQMNLPFRCRSEWGVR